MLALHCWQLIIKTGVYGTAPTAALHILIAIAPQMYERTLTLSRTSDQQVQKVVRYPRSHSAIASQQCYEFHVPTKLLTSFQQV